MCPWERNKQSQSGNPNQSTGDGSVVTPQSADVTVNTGLASSASVNKDNQSLEMLQTASMPSSEQPICSTVSTVDYRPIRDWMVHCDGEPTHKHCKVAQMQWQQLPGVEFKVIDIKRKCIVKAPPQCSFIALTYVWGKVQQPKLTEKTAPLLMREGGLETIWSQIPMTIRDAIVVSQELGERYLWVDALCITQDSERDMMIQILRMRQIYSAAKCTIAAVSSDSADAGLLGATMTSTANFSKPCDTIEELEQLLELAPWSSRAWCYQEKVLSHRIIMFTSRGIYLHCQEGVLHADGLALKRGNNTEGSEGSIKFDAVGGMLFVAPGEELESYISAV